MQQSILAADLHGHNEPAYRLDLFRRQLRALTNLAIHHKVRAVTILGDLFDKRYTTPGEVVLALLDELEYARDRGITWYLLTGNHDIPSKTNLTSSLLNVYSHIAYVFPPTGEIVATDNGHLLVFLPWAPLEQLRDSISSVAGTLARMRGSRSGKNILFLHTALKEGSLSRSNHQNLDALSVADLRLDTFHLVLLGDYHTEQWVVPDRVKYLGSIVEHSCRDTKAGGAYLFDIRTPIPKLTKVPFLEHQPRHLYWDLRNIKDVTQMRCPGYNDEDYNRIEVPVEFEEAAKSVWPDADIRPFVSKEEATRSSRLTDVDTNKPMDVLAQYNEVHDYDIPTQMMGKKYVDKALLETTNG